MARTFARQYGPFNRSIFEAGAGHPINFDSLVPSPQVFYAHSAYDTLPDRYSRPAKKGHGSYYLVTLEMKSTPIITVAVSALAGDLSIRSGKISHPRIHGNEFRMYPIRRGFEVPISRERAVRIASEFTGVKVREIPELVAPPVHDLAPQHSRWRIVLDHQVLFSNEIGKPIDRDTVYVDWEGHVVVESARSAAPDRHVIVLAGDSIQTEIGTFAARPGFPRHFQRVTRRIDP